MTSFISHIAMDSFCDGFMACLGRGDTQFIELLLREAGFAVSQLCCSRPSCFDYAARKGKTLFFIRFQPDVGGLSRNDSRELEAICESFSATSLVIGRESREKPLEDDTVYTRHNVLSVNPKTFENIVLRNVLPLVQASPGGYNVEIDGETLKRRRQELGRSVGEMAEIVGVSRRTLYGYERGLAKASVGAAYKLIWALGAPVAKPVDILAKSSSRRRQCMLNTARRVFARNKFWLRIFRRLTNWNATSVKRAPFDFVINLPGDSTKIIGGLANEEESELGRRIDEILSLSKVVMASPILITEGQTVTGKNIPCISCDDVARISKPEDLMANVK